MLIYFGLRIRYGECNFDNIKETGPYEVGYTTMKTKKGNFCAIYYPVDKTNTD